MTEVNLQELDESSFLRGEPEQLIQAVARPKILVVWLHGDETLGPRIGHFLQSERPDLLEHVDYLCGNPLAAQHDPPKEYIEADLNRSFSHTAQPTNYEEKQAQKILSLIRNNYDYVLDIHTTKTVADRFFLANRRNKAVNAIVANSPLSKIVLLPDKIARDGLIGQIPHSVSIEYNEEMADECGIEESLLLIEGLIQSAPLVEPRQREFFYVSHAVSVAEDPGLEVKNFKLCEEGYYPVLFGENSYRTDPTKQYIGFAATRKETTTL